MSGYTDIRSRVKMALLVLAILMLILLLGGVIVAMSLDQSPMPGTTPPP